MMAPVGSLEVPSDRAGAEGSPVKVYLGVNHTVTNLQLGGIDERFIIMFNRFLLEYEYTDSYMTSIRLFDNFALLNIPLLSFFLSLLH